MRDTLDQHLELLARRNLILRWHDRHIVPGSEWNSAIQEELDSARRLPFSLLGDGLSAIR